MLFYLRKLLNGLAVLGIVNRPRFLSHTKWVPLRNKAM